MQFEQATIEKHLKQAIINEELALFLNKSCKGSVYFNWLYVALFYSAMHYFGAFLESRGEHLPKKHDGERGALQRARDHFVFIDNESGKNEAAGGEYCSLFDWRRDVCYRPLLTKFLPKDPIIGFNALLQIKIVVFLQTGTKVRLSKKKKLLIEKITEKELDEMKNQCKAT